MGLLIALPLAFLGGVAGALAFPHWNLWPLLIPSVMILLGTLRWQYRSGKLERRVLLVSAVWGLGFFGPQLTWTGVSAGSSLPWIALTILETLFICFFAQVWVRGEQAIPRFPRLFGVVRLVWAPLAWVGVEQLRALLPFGGFPWAKLAFALVDTPLLAWAPWGGSALVSGVCVFIAAAALEFLGRHRGLLLRIVSLAALVAAVVFPTLVHPVLPEITGHVTAAAVQGNTPGRDPQTAFGKRYEVLQNHVDESLRLRHRTAQHVDVVLWAENAADVDPRTSPRAASLVNEVTAAFQAPLITGTLGAGPRGPGVASLAGNEVDTTSLQNTIFVWENGEARDTYAKKHLVPFGEYLPWRKFFATVIPTFAALVPTDLVAGESVAQLEVSLSDRDVRLASPICYEIADDDLVRQAVTGANFIYVPTSNSFFGSSDEADQQLAIARFRAAEHGLDTIQVSTMDSTARIDAHGQIVGRVIPNFTAGSFVTDIPLRSGTTPATVIGGLLGLGSLVLVVLAAVLQVLLALTESWKRGKH